MTVNNKDGAHSAIDKATGAGVLVAMGIVYGDIGTSPLYTYKAIIGAAKVDETLALGGLSAIFWTLTFLTTIKYVIFTLRADNNGEGGIFSLYALVRRAKKWLLFPAMIGGGFLLADGLITPPISVASAVEGTLVLDPSIPTIPIILVILSGLFAVQRLGTDSVGKIFGPIMLLWFTFIGATGFLEILKRPEVLAALNPLYAFKMVTEYPGGFWLLGGVFLCSTGAEALYSDMGHCGRGNIRISWFYVKVCLIFSYAGQAAWLLTQVGQPLTQSPYYGMLPSWIILPAIILATFATIIASQSLISGSFTLVNEAIRLGLWPNLRVVYPTDFKGQLYIPAINTFLWVGCSAVVLYFQKSEHMEAAFGLSVTMTMLMTTALIAYYLYLKGTSKILIASLVFIFLTIESTFFISNLVKFTHGGWVSVMMGLIFISIMWTWFRAREIKNSLTNLVPVANYLPMLKELSADPTVPRYATNLIFLTAAREARFIEQRIIYSIFQRQTKRADVYWFVHVEVLDEPFGLKYKTKVLAAEDVVYVTFYLGFRVEPRINLFFRWVVEDMVKSGEINITSRYESLGKRNVAGDFRFVIHESFLSVENELKLSDKVILENYFWLKRFAAITDPQAYGLDHSSVTIEKVPLIVSPARKLHIERLKDEDETA